MSEQLDYDLVVSIRLQDNKYGGAIYINESIPIKVYGFHEVGIALDRLHALVKQLELEMGN